MNIALVIVMDYSTQVITPCLFCPEHNEKIEELLYTQIPQSFPMILAALPINFQRNDTVPDVPAVMVQLV